MLVALVCICLIIFVPVELVEGSEPYPTPHTVDAFSGAVAVGLNLSVAGSEGVAYDLDVGRLAVLRYGRIVGTGYQGLSGLYVDKDALIQETLRVLGPVAFVSTTVGPEGVAVTGQLNTTGDIWCQGILRARSSLVVDGELLVGAGSGNLVVNRLSTTRSLDVRQDATMDGTTHLVGTTTLGSSPLVGVAQHVIPPGTPSTPEIPGVTQFLTGHLGNFSTLKGDWVPNGRGPHLTNDLPVRLGVEGVRQGELLIEGGSLAPANVNVSNQPLSPLKGGYDASVKSATYGKPLVQSGDGYLEAADLIAQQKGVSGVMTFMDGVVGVSATTVRGRQSQLTVGLDLAIGGYEKTKATCGNVSAPADKCNELHGSLRLYTGLPIESSAVSTVDAFETDAYATLSGQWTASVTSPLQVAGSFALLDKPFKIGPVVRTSDTVSPVVLQVVGNSSFTGFVDITGSYVKVVTTGATDINADSVSVTSTKQTKIQAGTDIDLKSVEAKITINAKTDCSVDAGSKATIKAGTEFSAQGDSKATIRAGSELNPTSPSISLTSNGGATMTAFSGATIDGGTTLELKSEISTTLKSDLTATITALKVEVKSPLVTFGYPLADVTIRGVLNIEGICNGCVPIPVRARRRLHNATENISDDEVISNKHRLLATPPNVKMSYELREGNGTQPGGIEPVYTRLSRALLVDPNTDFPANKALAVLGPSTLDGNVGITGKLHAVPSSTTPMSDPLVLPIRIAWATCEVADSSDTGTVTVTLPYAGYAAGAVTGFQSSGSAPQSLYVTKGGSKTFVLHCKTTPPGSGNTVTYKAQLTFYHEMIADVDSSSNLF